MYYRIAGYDFTINYSHYKMIEYCKNPILFSYNILQFIVNGPKLL